MTQPSPPTPPKRRKISRWTLLLFLPYLGLCFPQVYARSTPSLWGFPFFYWYQFAWVILASMIMAIVYRKIENLRDKDTQHGSKRIEPISAMR